MPFLKEVISYFSILRSVNDRCRQTGRLRAPSRQELAAWRFLHSQWLVPWWGRCSCWDLTAVCPRFLGRKIQTLSVWFFPFWKSDLRFPVPLGSCAVPVKGQFMWKSCYKNKVPISVLLCSLQTSYLKDWRTFFSFLQLLLCCHSAVLTLILKSSFLDLFQVFFFLQLERTQVLISHTLGVNY